jgi:hypothetical protein
MQTCNICGKKIKPIWWCGPKEDQKMYLECDTCIEYVCEKCSETDDETGTVECTMCMQQAALQKYKNITHTEGQQ